MIKEILQLGDPRLYEVSEQVSQGEILGVKEIVADLHDTMMAFREKYKAGRAIAAPQIGVFRRILYMNVGGTGDPSEGVAFINPSLSFPDSEKMEVIDDCMSFPGLYVKVMRYKRCVIEYRDLEWQECQMWLEGDLSELMQHEYDHLDGILAVMRAKDEKSLYFGTKPENTNKE